MTRYDIALIGGDSRTAYMAPCFAKKGFNAVCFNTVSITYGQHLRDKIHYTDELKKCIDCADIIVCGIPFLKDGNIFCGENKINDVIPLTEFQRCIHKHQMIFAGVIPDGFRAVCEEREIRCHDFMLDEPLSILNAVSTAEGAVLEALMHKNTTLHNSYCLVLGFGRCGKIIADRLKGMHSCVTVCSESEAELAAACALGFKTLRLAKLGDDIYRYEYLFNTIPACVLNRRCLERTSRDCLIIDIASNRAGADYEAAKELGINLRFCPGLPGKYSGKSCAKQLSKYVIRHMDAYAPKKPQKSSRREETP